MFSQSLKQTHTKKHLGLEGSMIVERHWTYSSCYRWLWNCFLLPEF